ncbi:MAG: hypothetical protein GX061_07240 [Eubacteriaceae bacterium]|nr:hypothetical protein [Eubacteriaceae bacterium]
MDIRAVKCSVCKAEGNLATENAPPTTKAKPPKPSASPTTDTRLLTRGEVVEGVVWVVRGGPLGGNFKDKGGNMCYTQK